MKELYSFKVNKKQEVEIVTETDAGKLISKETQSVPIDIFLKKPSRRELEQIDDVWAIEFSESVKKGILTKTMLAKAYDDSGGFISKKEGEDYLTLIERSAKLHSEYKLLQLKSEVDEEKVKEATKELSELFYRIQVFESKQSEIFEQCAEVRARNKAIQWMVTNLTFYKKGLEFVPFFVGDKQDDKQDSYYEVLEGDDLFSNQVIERAAIFLTFWYMGRATKPEDFKSLDDELQGSPK